MSGGNPARRWGWILIAGAVWTYWVWITRIFNVARQNQTTQFKVAHYILAAGSLAFASAAGVIGVRLRKSSELVRRP